MTYETKVLRIGKEETVRAYHWGVMLIFHKPSRSTTIGWTEEIHEEKEIARFNTEPRDQSHWSKIRAKLKEIAGDHHRAQQWVGQAYKMLRRDHFESRKKSWEDVLPPEIVKWAWGRLDQTSGNQPCVDNYRVARLGSTPQKRRYRSQHKRGCSGFADWKAKGPDGKWYALGYNYGH